MKMALLLPEAICDLAASFGNQSFAQQRDLLNVDDFICSVCREILKRPEVLPCSHKFCMTCLSMITKPRQNDNSTQQSMPSCPYCRQPYHPSSVQPAIDAHRKIQNSFAKCKFCDEKHRLIRMQQHIDICKEGSTTTNQSKIACKSVKLKSPSFANGVVAAGARERPGYLTDIQQTFDCPCCDVKRLGSESLREHVIANHKQLSLQVVCPICAAMPWGNPNQKSQNFVQHIEMRHNFDYTFFVDMQRGEDEALRDVLTRSMYDT